MSVWCLCIPASLSICLSASDSLSPSYVGYGDEFARRIVRLNDTYWLVQNRLRCNERAKGTKGCGSTFMSADRRILNQLPAAYQNLFPAVLSSRSGIDKDLLDSMRFLFKNSCGPLRVAKWISNQHALEFSRRELSYLHAILVKRRQVFCGPQFNPARFGGQFDKSKYNDYVPSANWLQTMYETILDEYKLHMDQQIQMRRTSFASFDHSFKGPPPAKRQRHGE